MEIASVGKVLSVKGGKATVFVDGKRKVLAVRGGLRLKAGDRVMVAFQSVVDKMK
jgi:hypothetical protein